MACVLLGRMMAVKSQDEEDQTCRTNEVTTYMFGSSAA